MSVLSALLKKQSEQNPSASYFNVDILKYQVRGRFLFLRDINYSIFRLKLKQVLTPALSNWWLIGNVRILIQI